MHAVAFAIATAAVLLAGLLVAVRLALPSMLETLLAWALLSVAEVMALVMLLGWVGALRSGWLVLGSVVVLLGVGVALKGGRFAEARAHAGAQSRRLRAFVSWTNLRAAPLAAFLSALAIGQVAYVAFAGWALPPTGYDTLTYHLPSVAYWVQRGQIVRTPYSLLTNVYPLNAELTFAWPAVLLRSDVLVNLGQIPFAFLGAGATAVLARTMGARRSGAVVAASLFLLAPVVAQQMAVAYVDLAFAGAFLTAFAFLLRGLQSIGLLGGAREPGSNPRLLVTYLTLAGIASGIGAGSKESGLAYLAVVGLVVLGALIALLVKHQLAPALLLRLVVAFALPVLLLGSFWYARNLVEHQNPLHPWNVQIAGVVLEHGPRGDGNDNVLATETPDSIAGASTPVQIARSWASEPLRTYNYDTRLGGSGLLWILAAVPALIVFVVRCALRRRDVLVLFLLPSILILVLQPANWWSRFTVFFLGVGFVALAVELGNLSRWNRSVLRLVEVAIAVVAVATFGLVNRRIATAGPKVVLDHATEGTGDRSAASAVETGGRFTWLSRIPATATIATRNQDLYEQFVYPLFGRHFDRKVVMLRGTDEKALLAQLARTPQVQYVLARTGAPLDRALRSAPDRYEVVERQGAQRIYRVHR